MAGTAAKKKSSKGNDRNSAKTKSGQKQSFDSMSWTHRLLLLALLWVLSLLMLFNMGVIGAGLRTLGTVFFGSAIYLLDLSALGWSIWYVAGKGKKRIPDRILWGYGCFVIAWMLAFGLPASSPDTGFSALGTILSPGPDGQIVRSSYGLAGGLLADLLVPLTSRPGALLIVLLLFALSIVLMFWNWIKMLLLSKSRTIHPMAKSRELLARLKKTAPAQSEPPVGQDNGAKSHPVIFDNGIEADFTDQPLEQEVDPEDLFQDPLDLFEPEQEPASSKEPPLKPRKPLRRSERYKNAAGSEEAARQKKKPDPKPVIQQKPAREQSEGTSLDHYQLPPLSLLDETKRKSGAANVKSAREQGQLLIDVLSQFGVDARLGETHIGPSVTEFEVIPGTGVRVNTFVNLQNDMKRALAAKDIRVEAPIPGKSAVGIEIPNVEKTAVTMKELMSAFPADLKDKPLAFCLGKDLTGTNIYGRLDTMPHLLIAGATGSGKSVCVNAIICSLLLRTRPDEVKLLLVDPKKVEFTQYNDLPHLLAPVITDAAMANNALKVICQMMDERYSRFEKIQARNLTTYNDYVRRHPGEEARAMPRIVVIIDELADLMTTASKEVEQSIQRITQLARAAGIHLIVATQRPSVNVITGTIKSNIPSRIAFMVSSRTDARTILDSGEADKLLGDGDMLFQDNGAISAKRLQGVFIKDHEVEAICSFVKGQAAPEYNDSLIELRRVASMGNEAGEMELDPLYDKVRDMVIREKKASTSSIQRFFHIGYGRAASILDQLEMNHIVGPVNGTRPREVLVSSQDDKERENL